MKKITLAIGSISIATSPMMILACSNSDTPTEAEPIVFDLKTVSGIKDIYSTFIQDNDEVAEDGKYEFKIDDASLSNDWTADEIKAIKNTSMDTGFDLTGMELQDASDTIEKAFNNMPRLENWDDYVLDTSDGILNHYFYYDEFEKNADPENKNGEWGNYNVKGHRIYDDSKKLIESTFGQLPANLDLYHVERGGDSAKNLYFKLIDRTTDEILEDSFKIDIKWDSTQEEIDKFGNGFFTKIMNSGKELFGRTKALFTKIVEKNDYTSFKPFIENAVTSTFEKMSDVIWDFTSPLLIPFSKMPGANMIYGKLMDLPISKGTSIVMTYLDGKFIN